MGARFRFDFVVLAIATASFEPWQRRGICSRLRVELPEATSSFRRTSNSMVLLAWMSLVLYSKFHLSLGMAAFDAAIYPQHASIAGAFCGGWLADLFAQRTQRGRVLVQCAGVLLAAPFVVLCGRGHSLLLSIVALVSWGFFKDTYDSNIVVGRVGAIWDLRCGPGGCRGCRFPTACSGSV